MQHPQAICTVGACPVNTRELPSRFGERERLRLQFGKRSTNPGIPTWSEKEQSWSEHSDLLGKDEAVTGTNGGWWRVTLRLTQVHGQGTKVTQCFLSNVTVSGHMKVCVHAPTFF